MSPRRPYNQEQHENDAQPAGDDVCDVSQGAIRVDERNAAFWIDADRRRRGIGRKTGACKGRGRFMLQL